MFKKAKERQRKYHSFQHRYKFVCKRMGLTPLPFVKSHLIINIIDFNVDKVKFHDWIPITHCLKRDRAMVEICLKSRFARRKLVDTKNEMEALSTAECPALFRKFVFTRFMYSLTCCLFYNKVLTRLELEGFPLGDHAYMTLLCRGIKRCKTIRDLSLCHSPIGDEGCHKLCLAIWKSDNLSTLNLSQCELGEDGACIISKMIMYQCCKLTFESKRSLTSQGSPLPVGLRRIILNGNTRIGDKGLLLLIGSLQYDKYIKALDLQNCSISDVGARALIELLCTNKSLQVTDVRRNNISEALLADIQFRLRKRNKDIELEFKPLPLIPKAVKRPPAPKKRRTYILHKSVMPSLWRPASISPVKIPPLKEKTPCDIAKIPVSPFSIQEKASVKALFADEINLHRDKVLVESNTKFEPETSEGDREKSQIPLYEVRLPKKRRYQKKENNQGYIRTGNINFPITRSLSSMFKNLEHVTPEIPKKINIIKPVFDKPTLRPKGKKINRNHHKLYIKEKYTIPMSHLKTMMTNPQLVIETPEPVNSFVPYKVSTKVMLPPEASSKVKTLSRKKKKKKLIIKNTPASSRAMKQHLLKKSDFQAGDTSGTHEKQPKITPRKPDFERDKLLEPPKPTRVTASPRSNIGRLREILQLPPRKITERTGPLTDLYKSFLRCQDYPNRFSFVRPQKSEQREDLRPIYPKPFFVDPSPPITPQKVKDMINRANDYRDMEGCEMFLQPYNEMGTLQPKSDFMISRKAKPRIVPYASKPKLISALEWKKLCEDRIRKLPEDQGVKGIPWRMAAREDERKRKQMQLDKKKQKEEKKKKQWIAEQINPTKTDPSILQRRLSARFRSVLQLPKVDTPEYIHLLLETRDIHKKHPRKALKIRPDEFFMGSSPINYMS